jgi:hypothetical protein
MIFFSSKKLEAKLAHNQLSDWEKVKYMLIPSMLSSLLSGPIFFVRPYYGPHHSTLQAIGSLAGGILVAIAIYWGIKRNYQTNEKIDGKNFIVRWVILSFPVFNKFLVGFLPGTLIFLIVSAAATRNSPEVRKYIPTLLTMVFPALLVWMYCLIDASFKRFGKLIGRA